MADALAIHEAYKRGDLDALRALLGAPPDFPNCRGPTGVGEIILEYAIYHAPLPFIRGLLEQGADPNYQDHAGFPSLIAALSSARANRYEIVRLLLSFGPDIQQRGVNDWTPLHYAAANNDVEGIEILLAHGADPTARTRIDDCATPLEEAEHLGRAAAARTLRRIAPGVRRSLILHAAFDVAGLEHGERDHDQHQDHRPRRGAAEIEPLTPSRKIL